MIEFSAINKELKIIIPLNNIKELYAYQKGVLGLLNEVELEKCDQDRKRDIQRVYELLSHLYIENGDNLASN